ncbi:MAG TPA: methyltransferase domain-containing protein [Acidimicrobiales bacterium]|jgi:SAM-dependent methyltransferase
MVSPRLAPVVRRGRDGLVQLASRVAPVRRAMARAGEELERAARIGEVLAEARAPKSGAFYGPSYFGVGRDATGDRQGHSGYASYDRVSSNADIAAYLLWRNFRAQHTLDVGCARGFVVEALRELGVDAHGCDVSPYAVAHAAPGALGFVRLGDLGRTLPYADGEFDLVSAMEVLEHLEPAAVPAALRELGRVCGGVLYATIPSFGPNPSGPDGHLAGKVRPERLGAYEALGPGYDGPVPLDDLERDADGQPVEGHLTIASYRWWTARFAEAGFVRWPDVEARLHADLAPTGLGAYWDLYVLAVPDAPPALAAARHPAATLADLGLVHPLLEAAGDLR